MTIAIMQPYLFPYIGYWQLIDAVDKFVVYDNIQFEKGGWFNKNNILLFGKKTLFSIPLKKDSYQLDVVERRLADHASQQIDKILRQIENGYKKAPYFNDVFPLLESIFSFDEKNLFFYTYNSIMKVAEYLDIDTEIVVSSTLKIDHTLKGEEKVLAINKYLHADHYINAIGGQSLYVKETFAKAGVKLNFIDTKIIEYKQFDDVFVPFLSIIDIMMFNSKEKIQTMLKSYTLI
ncbi:WbqC family protein [Sulfurimonas sp. HSL3-7]|uniref:WbqC family protein n=1 Tax=Sulfonitrofixus jiaomeiensis TaxID=3131938 RepID=UPI0031F984CD